MNFARESGLDLAVRGGGHSVPGFGTCDGGVVIDLSAMRGVRVDPSARTARAEGGATWGDFNAATHAVRAGDDRRHHLDDRRRRASPSAAASATSRAGCGLSLRQPALGRRGDRPTAASWSPARSENADLFWALRGGGGNFGVVTSFEFRLHPVKDIYGGPMFFELDEAGTCSRFYREFIADAPRAVRRLPGVPDRAAAAVHPGGPARRAVLAMVACWSGDLDQGEKALKPFHDLAPVVAEMVGPMPYPALNSAFDALVPPGLQHYWKANFVKELTDDAIAAHAASTGRRSPS